jgi:hypothetical protein
MKRILHLIAILTLTAMACSLGGVTGSQATVEVPTQVVEQVQPTIAPTFTLVPTLPLPTLAPTEAVVEQPTEQPPVEPDPEVQFIAWVVAGDASKSFTEFYDDKIVLELPKSETYSYVRMDGVDYDDVYVEVTAETMSPSSSNGLAVMCRASELGWYELRVSTVGPNTGSWMMYFYNYRLKEQGKNPYVRLIKTTEKVNSVHIVNGYNLNSIALSCIGNEIRPYINGVEQIYNKTIVTDDNLSSGMVGFGGMSFGVGPVTFEFTDFSTSVP